MSARLQSALAGLRKVSSLLGEAIPTSETSPEEREAFIKRAKAQPKSVSRFLAATGKGTGGLIGSEASFKALGPKKDLAKERLAHRQRAITVVARPAGVRMKDPAGIKRSLEKIGQEVKKVWHTRGLRPKSTVSRAKPEAIHGRKAEKSQRKTMRPEHGGGAAAKVTGRRRGGPIGRHDLPYDPAVYEANMYIPRTLIAAGLLDEGILLEKRGKHKAKKEAQFARAFPGKQEGSKKAPPAPPEAPRPGGKKEKKSFKELRGEGKLKQHKEKKSDEGKAKYENPTTFKKCPKGAMLSTPHLRHNMPLNTFVKKDADYPTYPIRPNCRASLAGVARSLQYANPSGAVVDQVLKRANKGEVRGSRRLKLWGTGVGGQRMKTHRGPSGKAKRHASYGTSTGERDERLHTAQSEHGKAGNREVARAPMHAAKGTTKKKETKRKRARQQAGEKASIDRSKRTLGLPAAGRSRHKPEPEGRGAAEAEKFQKRAAQGKKQKKTHKKSKSQKKRERRERQGQ